MDIDIPRGSSARQPDLSWSQVRETVLMLELAAVQIETSMKDSNASVDVLTASFTTMAEYMRTMLDTLESLPDDGQVGEAKARLTGMSEHVAGQVHQAIIAFQFYDKLVQRLTHVGNSLGELGDLIGDSNRLFSPAEWVALQEQIRSKYSTREERAMFEAVIQGVPVHEALDHYRAEIEGRNSDIELF